MDNLKDKRYTKIPNILLEGLYKTPLSGTMFRIILFILRMTFGWHKKNRCLSYNFIAKETNLNKRSVNRAIDRLTRAGIIIKIKDGRKNRFSVNSDYSTWKLWITHRSRGLVDPHLSGHLTTK